MKLQEKFDDVFKLLNSDKTRNEKKEIVLGQLRQKAELLRNAKNIILCGATPFAKNVLNNRDYIFAKDVELQIEDFNREICVRGGGVYVLCSRPNISKHLKCLGQFEDIHIISYQLLLVLEPRFSTMPYAYTYEKIVKQIEDIIEHASEYYHIYNNLSDDKSKELFMKMILFRLTSDYKMHYGNATEYDHYFDADIFSLGNEEIYADCGGYTGDTLETVRRITGDCFKKYYLFEPDKNLIRIAMEKGDFRVIFINKGVWKSETTLYFKEQTAPGNGTFHDTESNETIQVPVVSLDHSISKVTFIKMDIEGSELMGLQGAKNLIRRCRPKLAICVYHKSEDYREIFDYVNQLGNYNIYLRAEMDNIDTELYYICIPYEE